ncbi:MAG: Imm43 family immunity protein [Cardiobacteriaceae bacterium]|nr:Imm43 family immunity protein [Cardiobacteriaceae bacterium]
MKKLSVWGYSYQSLDELEERKIPIVSLGTVGISEQFNLKKTHPDFDFPWVSIWKEKPIQPMPDKVFICLKKVKSVNFDFLTYAGDFYILSEKLLDFLRKHGFDYQFDMSRAIIVNTKGEPLTDQTYYLMRVITWEIQDEIIYTYPEKNSEDDEYQFALSAYTNLEKDILLSTNFKYFEAFMVTENIKEEILKNFDTPFLYSLEEWKEQNNYDSYWD